MNPISYAAASQISSQVKTRGIRWTGHVAGIGEMKNAYRILVGKPERKRQHDRPSRRWENGIMLDLREIMWEGCGLDASGSR
jgi:hypothetical protein